MFDDSASATRRPFSRRGEIRLGYRCNARCGFCYYQGLLDNPIDKEPSIEQLKKRLRNLRDEGAIEVEFTGGEPTIRHDIVELIAYARALGFINVSMISNGLRLANPTFARKLVEAGVNDFLFSIHGHDDETHDAHTQIPGSYKKIVQAVANAKAYGARVRSTTTITGRNFRHVQSILESVIDLKVECVHLAVFSPVADTRETVRELFVSYSDASASIKRSIDELGHQLPPLSIKYIPFCFMRGYEQYVMNLYQQNHDLDDWNYYLSNKIRRTNGVFSRLAFDLASLIGAAFARGWRRRPPYTWREVRTIGFTRLVELIRKKRLATCKSCAYDLVCDHAWRDYVEYYGDAEFQAVPGVQITDPAWCYVMSGHRSQEMRLGSSSPRLIPSIQLPAAS